MAASGWGDVDVFAIHQHLSPDGSFQPRFSSSTESVIKSDFRYAQNPP
jgi:hypothetical protein